jgi:hypothetical protein
MTMSALDVREQIASAGDLVWRARAAALYAAETDPDSTWIDAFCAIDQCLSQLSTAAWQTAVQLSFTPSEPEKDRSCEQLLELAQRALAAVPAGHGPPSMPLVHAYLTEAINEARGREQ